MSGYEYEIDESEVPNTSASRPDTVSTTQRNALKFRRLYNSFHTHGVPSVSRVIANLGYKSIRVVGLMPITYSLLQGAQALCNIIAVSRYQNKTQRNTSITERQIQFRRKCVQCLCLWLFLGPLAEAVRARSSNQIRIPEMSLAS